MHVLHRWYCTLSTLNTDPNAAPYEEYAGEVDAVLRDIAHNLLLQNEQSVVSTALLTPTASAYLVAEKAGHVGKCLRYLRERIGVPRDLSIHAAMQFRAILTGYIDAIEQGF